LPPDDDAAREQADALGHNAVEVISTAELAAKLAEKRPLRIKLGMDPTSPDLHLGHSITLKKLRDFQERGHTVIFLVGDFTAMIGDPTGRSETRKPLSPDQIKANAATYQGQVAKVLDPFLLALYSIPRIALAPMLIVWFGIGYSSKIFLGATLVFFITFFNTLSGIRSVDKALCDIARVMKATEWQVFRKVMLPSASSWILTSVKISLPFALVGVILGEFLVSSQGLGYRLNRYSTSYNITGALAIVFLMMAIMLVLTAITNAIEARVLRWRPQSAAERVAQT